jgi:hypothetical protein
VCEREIDGRKTEIDVFLGEIILEFKPKGGLVGPICLGGDIPKFVFRDVVQDWRPITA